MKIPPRETQSTIKNPSKFQAILLYGPDEGMIREYKKQLIKNLTNQSEETPEYTNLSADTVKSEPSYLFEALSSISLLGDAPIVVIDQATDKISSSLKEALNTESCQNFLIVCSRELSPRSSLRSLFEKEKQTAAIACYKDEGHSLTQYIKDFLNEKKITYNADCLNYLASNLGNDRGVTRSELEKIDLYLGEERTLNLEILETLILGNSNQSLDDLCHAIMEGNQQKLNKLYEQLILEGNQPVAILRTILKHLERLVTVQQYTAQNIPVDEAMKKLSPPIFFKQVGKFKQQLRSLSQTDMQKSIGGLLQAERQIKRYTDAKTICLYYLTAITQKAARSNR